MMICCGLVFGTYGNRDGTLLHSCFHDLRGIAVDLDATTDVLYVSDNYYHLIRKVDISADEVTRIAGSSQGCMDGANRASRFNTPYDLVVHTRSGAAGPVIFVSDSSNHRIRSVTKLAQSIWVTTLAGSGSSGRHDGPLTSARFHTQRGLCKVVDASTGAVTLYVVGYTYEVIRKVSVEEQQVTTIAGLFNQPGNVDGPALLAQFRAPSFITADTTRNPAILYVSEPTNAQVRSIDLATQMVYKVAGVGTGTSIIDGVGSVAGFAADLSGIAFDASANGRGVYIADTGNYALRYVTMGTQSPTANPTTTSPTTTVAPSAVPTYREFAYNALASQVLLPA
jgi:hypothetical protein